jgi:hypothetical protein
MVCRKCRKMFMVPAEIGQAEPSVTVATDALVDDDAIAPFAAATEVTPSSARAAAPAPYVGFNKKRAAEADELRNPLAIASLACGLLGVIVPVLPGVAAIALGIAAIRKTLDSRYGGQGKAVAGIALGVFSFALHGCIYTIVWPRWERAAETANRAACASHLRQVGLALHAYAKAHQNQFPDKPELALLSGDGNCTSKDFVCPSSFQTPAPGATPAEQAKSLSSGGHLSYTYAGRGHVAGVGGDKVILLYEPLPHHGSDGINVLMENGEVRWVRTRNAERIVSELAKGHNPPQAPPGGWYDE